MRSLAIALATISATLFLAAPADASCAAPASVAENGARAVTVVHGTVTQSGGGAVVLRVTRVLKGQASSEVRAFVGPGRGGAAGAPVGTSVDYSAPVGTEHVLYLVRSDDGQLETNACIGSHPGGPDAAELAYFGAGATPVPIADPDPPPLAETGSPFGAVAAIAAALLATIVGIALISWRRGIDA